MEPRRNSTSHPNSDKKIAHPVVKGKVSGVRLELQGLYCTRRREGKGGRRRGRERGVMVRAREVG